MSSSIVTPAGMFGGLQPATVIVEPIAAEDFLLGDVVMFDLKSTNATYTDAAQLTNYNHKKCPFNVVISGGGTLTSNHENGIFGVVMADVRAGKRAKVCIGGLCNAKILAASIAAGVTVSASAITAKSFTPTVNGEWPAVAVVLVQTVSANAITPVLLSGYAIGSNGA
jgi:hypothetical protein